MKKIIVLSILCTLSLSAFSQKNFQKGKKLESLSADQIATLQTKKMTLHLDLNLKQQHDIFNIMLEEIKFKRNKKSEMQQQRSETNNELSSDEIFEIMNDKLDHQIAFNNKIKTILSKDQFSMWQENTTQQKQIMKKQMHKKRAL